MKPFPNPRGFKDLHSYMDDILGSDAQGNNSAKVTRIGDQIIKKFPRGSFGDEDLKAIDDLTPWAKASFALAVEKVYVPLGDHLDHGVQAQDIPDEYEQSVRDVAQRQVALAGYRLAEVLKSLFP